MTITTPSGKKLSIDVGSEFSLEQLIVVSCVAFVFCILACKRVLPIDFIRDVTIAVVGYLFGSRSKPQSSQNQGGQS